jgi:hypothetical protein
MVRQATKMFTILAILTVGIASAADEVQWVRVTALLEPGSGATVRAEQTMVPGGVYSLAEVDRRGMDAIDQEILKRTEFLSGQMRDVEEAMRLATLLARQYYLPLEVGEDSVLPVIDLNPRLGIVITPLRFVGDRAVCMFLVLSRRSRPIPSRSILQSTEGSPSICTTCPGIRPST